MVLKTYHLLSALLGCLSIGGATLAQVDSSARSVDRVADNERSAPSNRLPPGTMLIEGDVIVPSDFFSNVAATYRTNLWPGGIVPYEFDANVTSENRTRTLAAMAEWEARANVDFRPRSGDANYLHIQSSNQNSSYVGLIGGGQVLNMYNWNLKYVIAHELAHALGFWHEQSRADRNSSVQINYGNIQPGAEHNFDIRPNPGGEYGPYDFDSVMHYSQFAFSTGGITIDVLAPFEVWQNKIGQLNHLSDFDGRGMGEIYGFSGPDCNTNHIRDPFEVQNGTAADCNNNVVPDECEIAGGAADCTANGILDVCESAPDCNLNSEADFNDICNGADDCTNNAVPDFCEHLPDCNGNSTADFNDQCSGTSEDCDSNAIPDECETLADCNGNDVPDECDIGPGFSVDCNLNGVPDECESPGCLFELGPVDSNSGGARSLGGPYEVVSSIGQHGGVGPLFSTNYQLLDGFWHLAGAPFDPPPEITWNPDSAYVLRATRSITFSVAASTASGGNGTSAIQVRMIDLQNPIPPNAPCCPVPDFSAYESVTCTAVGETGGCARWVGPPVTILESQGNAGLGSFTAARLQCTPYYTDWTTLGEVTIFGAEIMPSSTYELTAFASSCKGVESSCTNISAPVQALTRRSGDVASVFNPPGTSPQPDAIDVVAMVNKFRNVAGAPSKRSAQIQPNVPELNADINALDIVTVVDAFRGLAFPFSGPCACPSSVTCNATPCTSPAQCSGGTCVKTCSGGTNADQPCITNAHCPSGTCGSGFCRDKCGRCDG